MRITSTVIDIIKDSPSLQAEIAEALEVRLSTVARYLRDESDELTKAAAMQVIRKHTEFTDDQILEPINA